MRFSDAQNWKGEVRLPQWTLAMVGGMCMILATQYQRAVKTRFGKVYGNEFPVVHKRPSIHLAAACLGVGTKGNGVREFE